MSNEEIMHRYAILGDEWPPKVEGIEWIKTTSQQEDELKAAIRAAKAELRVARAGAREVRRQGRSVSTKTVEMIAQARIAVQEAKEGYREWKRTRR